MNELFLKIINMSISASWLVLAVLMLRLVLKKAPKWVNVLLWGIVAVRLLCPFSIESALSLIPSAETFPEKVISGPSFGVQTGIAPVDNRINDYLGDHYFEGVTVPANNGANVMTVLAAVWVIGVLLLAAYTAISCWRLHRKVDMAVLCKDNIFQSENISSPFVFGIIKPRIYLPFNMNAQDFEHVVAHEQAHIRRKDHWWKPLGFLLLAIHWFNPLVWLAYVLLCRDIELACDEKVIKELGSEQRADYTQALVACSVNRPVTAACPLAFGEVGVKTRVKAVMDYKKPAFWIIVVAVFACLALAVCFLTNPVSDEPDPSFLNTQEPYAGKTCLYEKEGFYGDFTITLYNDGTFTYYEGMASSYIGMGTWEQDGDIVTLSDDHFTITNHFTMEGDDLVFIREGSSNFIYVRVQDGERFRCTGEAFKTGNGADSIENTPDVAAFEAEILEVHDGYFLVEPVAGSWELSSADRIEVPMKNMDPSLEPQAGDIIEIEYSGEILETYPARLHEVYSIRVVNEAKAEQYIIAYAGLPAYENPTRVKRFEKSLSGAAAYRLPGRRWQPERADGRGMATSIQLQKAV